METVIRIEDLWKWYGTREALKGIDLQVPGGQFISILGPNGAGKTTLIKCITGLARCQMGAINIYGLDLRKNLREIKGRMGIVHQENNLDVYLNVMENLYMYGYMLDIDKNKLERKIPETLHFMGIKESLWFEKVENLSGGTKRKLMIARALLNDPEILIMDEPTTGLDPSIRRLLWDRIISLKEKKITLILTTHYMEEAHYISDRVVIMHSGRIIEDGKPDELIERYLPPFAVELSPPVEFNQEYKSIRSGDTIIIYTQKPEMITSRIEGRGLRKVSVRKTNLEDVFLLLTGNRL